VSSHRRLGYGDAPAVGVGQGRSVTAAVGVVKRGLVSEPDRPDLTSPYAPHPARWCVLHEGAKTRQKVTLTPKRRQGQSRSCKKNWDCPLHRDFRPGTSAPRHPRRVGNAINTPVTVMIEKKMSA
jgi:hypothetical protein